MRIEQALARAQTLADTAKSLNGIAVVANDAGVMPSADALRTLALEVRDRLGDANPVVVALIGRVNDKPSIVVVTNEKARQRKAKAGAFVRAVGQHLGGGGGGRDDIAQGGGTKLDAIKEALDAIRREVAHS